jgi:sugar fermentation stimulation protein A
MGTGEHRIRAMKFPAPLIRGTLIKRYKRFLADVLLDDGREVVAHCANSGSMLTVCEPGSEVWVSPAANPDRKLQFSWELIRIGRSLVGINTMHPNKLAAEAIANGTIVELQSYASIRREVKYGKNSRIDLLLESPARPPCFVEVKNVTLVRHKGLAEFPDSVTARGAKHLDELIDQAGLGNRAVMLYLAQRGDCTAFAACHDIDPIYGKGLIKAARAGVEILAYGCRVTAKEIKVVSPIPLAAFTGN